MLSSIPLQAKVFQSLKLSPFYPFICALWVKLSLNHRCCSAEPVLCRMHSVRHFHSTKNGSSMSWERGAREAGRIGHTGSPPHRAPSPRCATAHLLLLQLWYQPLPTSEHTTRHTVRMTSLIPRPNIRCLLRTGRLAGHLGALRRLRHCSRSPGSLQQKHRENVTQAEISSPIGVVVGRGNRWGFASQGALATLKTFWLARLGRRDATGT